MVKIIWCILRILLYDALMNCNKTNEGDSTFPLIKYTALFAILVFPPSVLIQATVPDDSALFIVLFEPDEFTR